jgi:hypothetical protein
MSNECTPLNDEEIYRYRLREPEPDYPPIPDIEYCMDVRPRSGGFGFVYQAKRLSLRGRPIAVKVAHRRTVSNDEAFTLAELQHSNVVTIHHAGLTPDKRRYIITEWLEGGSLDDWLQANVSLSPRDWAELFETIAQALDATHIAGFLHRDIKPSNILFLDTGKDWFRRPKLGDFGLAFRGTKGPANSGTRGYQAPELLEKNGYSTRFSDVYALGVTMRQCLGGSLPTEGTPLLPLPKVRRVPLTLKAIVAKCLTHSEHGRYGNRGINVEDKEQRPAWQLAKDLQAFREHRPTLARPLNRAQSVCLWARRSPWQAVAFTTLTLGLISSGGFAWQFRRAEVATRARLTAVELAKRETEAKLRARELADVRRYAQQLQQASDQIKSANSVAAIAILDNCDKIYHGGWEWLFLRGQCDTAVDGFNLGSPVQAIAVAVDNRLAVAAAGGKIYLGAWGTDLARTNPIHEPEQRGIRQMWFRPDRLLTASTVRRGDSQVVAAVLDSHSFVGSSSFEPVGELFVPGEFVGDGPVIPVLTPDGGAVVFPGKQGTLKSLELASGLTRIVAEQFPRISALRFRGEGSNAMLVALDGERVRFWTWPELRPLNPLSAQRGPLLDLTFAGDDTLVLLNGASEVSLWARWDDWEPVGSQPNDRRPGIRRLSFAPSRKDVFVTVGETLTRWTIDDTGVRAFDLLGLGPLVTAVAFSPDGQTLFGGDEAGTVKRWNLTPKKTFLMSADTEVRQVSADGDMVVARIYGGEVKLEGGPPVKLDGMKPVGLRLENKATRLLVNDDRGRVVVVHVATGEVLITLTVSS